MHNKRGQGLSTNAIILIVLGIFVLAILIVGFTMGWSKIAPWISTTNVDDVSQACSIACSIDNQYDFCSVKRELVTQDSKLKDFTCDYISNQRPEFGFENCPINCENIEFWQDTNGDNLLDENDCVSMEGKTIQALIDNTLLSYDCPAAPTP